SSISKSVDFSLMLELLTFVLLCESSLRVFFSQTSNVTVPALPALEHVFLTTTFTPLFFTLSRLGVGAFLVRSRPGYFKVSCTLGERCCAPTPVSKPLFFLF